MQRLLMEGMRFAWHTPGHPPLGAGAQMYDQRFAEAYGHLAAALRPCMIEATDQGLETLMAPRFSCTLAVCFKFGAGPRATILSPLSMSTCHVFLMCAL